MRNFFTLLFSMILFANISCAQPPIKIILDTDMDSDIDDVSAMGLLHHFADLGEVEILATVSCSSNKGSVQVIDAINTFYNRPDIPVGIPKEDAPPTWLGAPGRCAFQRVSP